MSTLIRNREIAANDLTLLDDEAPVPTAGKVVVSLARWQQHQAALRGEAAETGVRIPNTIDLAGVWPDLADRKLLVIEFPAFGDGRAYSQARLLRDRYQFQGDILAVGAAVVRDQLHNMQRAGINAFLLREDQNPQECLTAFDDFALAYQKAADPSMPIVQEQRRRGA